MKKKILTTNVDVAAVAAFGGLTVMPMFPIFFEMHGFYFSAVAFVITLWGLLSLKQLDTPEPEKKRWKKVGTTTALILFLSGGLLFGTLDATQIEPPPCEPDQIDSGCFLREDKPICPNINPIPRCPLEAAREQGQLNKEYTHE